MASQEKEDFELTQETKNYLQSLFEEKDEDQSGCINADELGECLRSVGFCVTDADLDFLVENFDRNRDGRLSIKELMDNLHLINAHSIGKKDMMDAFHKFDKNGDGFIRLPELLQILTLKGGFEVQEARELLDYLVKNFDKNGDGKFDYPEFIEMYLSTDFPFKSKAELQEQQKS